MVKLGTCPGTGGAVHQVGGLRVDAGVRRRPRYLDHVRMIGWVAAGVLVRWSLRENSAGQSGQEKRFSPVCVPVVAGQLVGRVNFLSQSGQSQEKGSPVWVRWWDFRCDDL